MSPGQVEVAVPLGGVIARSSSNSVIVMTEDGSESDDSAASLSFTTCSFAELSSTSSNASLTHSNYSNIVLCTHCPPGTRVDPSGLACLGCPPETYSEDGGQCSACAPGTFQPNASSARCWSCDARPDMPECAVGSWVPPLVIVPTMLAVLGVLLVAVLTWRQQRQGRCLCSARQKEDWQRQQQCQSGWSERDEDDGIAEREANKAVVESMTSLTTTSSYHIFDDAAQGDVDWAQQGCSQSHRSDEIT